MRKIPKVPIYFTANGVKSLKGHYHQDWNFVPVKIGDTLDLCGSKLVFIEAPMLHWPDSMFTYMTGENILFINDGIRIIWVPDNYAERECIRFGVNFVKSL